MKRIISTFACIVFLGITTTLAQPLPPQNPLDARPVPITKTMILVISACVLGINKINKNRKSSSKSRTSRSMDGF